MRVRTTILALALAFCALSPANAEQVTLDVERAEAHSQNGAGAWQVLIRLTPDGGTALTEFTSTHVQRPIRLLVDDVVRATPFIHEPLFGRSLIIGNLTTAEDAKRMAAALRTGRSVLAVAPYE